VARRAVAGVLLRPWLATRRRCFGFLHHLCDREGAGPLPLRQCWLARPRAAPRSHARAGACLNGDFGETGVLSVGPMAAIGAMASPSLAQAKCGCAPEVPNSRRFPIECAGRVGREFRRNKHLADGKVLRPSEHGIAFGADRAPLSCKLCVQHTDRGAPARCFVRIPRRTARHAS